MAGQAASFHVEFVRNLTASATSYASAEATNIGLMQPINAISGSIGGAISGLTNQAADFFDSLESRLLS